jgi:hypothetical protein
VPMKSKAQDRFMFAAEARGDLKAGTAKRFADETPGGVKSLPERVGAKKKGAGPVRGGAAGSHGPHERVSFKTKR